MGEWLRHFSAVLGRCPQGRILGRRVACVCAFPWDKDLPDPFGVPRAVLHSYPVTVLRPQHYQDMDAGTFLFRMHRKMQDVCWLQQTLLRWPCSCHDPEQTTLSLHVCTEGLLTHHLSYPFLTAPGLCDIWVACHRSSAASAWRSQSLNLFSLSSPKYSSHIALDI